MVREELQKFVCGGIAGAVAKTSIAPFDRVKVLFQTTVRSFSLRSAYFEISRIYTQEGIRAFWKGNFVQLVRIIPYSAIQFMMYDYFKRNYFQSTTNQGRAQTLLYNFLPGSIAGAIAVTWTYPFEVVRTRLAVQVTSKIYTGIFHAFSHIGHNEGYKGLFNGFSPTMLGIVVYSGTTFSLYFSSKEIIGHKGSKEHFLFGAVSGLLGQLSSYPFEVIRKRMQAHGFIEKVSSFKSSSGDFALKGWMSYGFMIVKTEGVKGLFKGFTMNMVKSPIASGIVHTSNEALNLYANKSWKK
ncbi:SLC25A42_2 [Blepharisma stoltei]|uniref:Mitochondrial carrier protein n=1 Tax=Blepharisma stoltei TaxID=1481888 RepID=A0AAU9JDZ5_9CILI|nr:unnamed protein product [Blepharisma stoltei]